jgi:hypothetical protein
LDPVALSERMMAQIAGLEIPTATGPLHIRCSAGLTSTATFSKGFEPAEPVVRDPS